MKFFRDDGTQLGFEFSICHGRRPPTGRRIEAELMPGDDPFLQLSVRLGKSGNVVYKLPAMLKMEFRVVECTPGELAVMEAFEISFTGSPPPFVRLSTG